ncbi:hypothetical protein BGZ60DRAFT_523047 [Tricladium varicosporioides]|nr:hypothetical protein BGZ60DRAFT_523047 [Hymenoscyphus varicosporioides]
MDKERSESAEDVSEGTSIVAIPSLYEAPEELQPTSFSSLPSQSTSWLAITRSQRVPRSRTSIGGPATCTYTSSLAAVNPTRPIKPIFKALSLPLAPHKVDRKEITAPIPVAIFDMQAQSYPLHPWNGHEQNPTKLWCLYFQTCMTESVDGCESLFVPYRGGGALAHHSWGVSVSLQRSFRAPQTWQASEVDSRWVPTHPITVTQTLHTADSRVSLAQYGFAGTGWNQ